MIKLKNVSKYYNNNGVVTLGLRNINLQFSSGEIVAIVGESGSGKSTLLNVICGVDSYEEGEIIFKDNETSYFNNSDMDVFRKKYVSFIYQSYNIIDSYTVLENVMLPLIINGIDKATAKNKALELIKRVGLSHRVKHKGIKLSGGEKQRCVIARALATDAPILACDEPTGNLDSNTGIEIINLIKEVASDKLVLIVTHNYEQVKDIVSRTIRLSDGEVIEDNIKSKVNHSYEKEDLNLETDKLNRKALNMIACQNLKNTPKKNILSFLVLFVLSFIGLFLYLYGVSTSELIQYNSDLTFQNTIHNRIIVYDKDHKSLDITKLKDIDGIKIQNGFYEDILSHFECDSSYYHSTFSTYIPNNLENEKGSKIQNDNECYVIIPEIYISTYFSNFNDYLGKDIYIDSINKTFKLCGYASSNEIMNILLVLPNDYGKEILLYQGFDKSAKVTTNDNEIKTSFINFSNDEKTIVKYYGPSEVVIDKIELNLFELYTQEITDFSVVYEYAEYTTVEIITPYNNEIYEYTIYADNPEEAVKEIEELGYSYIQPAKSGYNKTSFSYILFIGFTCIVSIAMVVLTFIAYIILSKVFASKIKDYTILRSLGVLKKQMAKIVNREVIILGQVASVAAILTAYIISIFSPSYKLILSYNSFVFMILYFVLMLIFNYFISLLFNKRLFKFTVTTSIKEEVE